MGASVSGGLVRGITTHLVCRRMLDAFASAKYTKVHRGPAAAVFQSALRPFGVPVMCCDHDLDTVPALAAGYAMAVPVDEGPDTVHALHTVEGE